MAKPLSSIPNNIKKHIGTEIPIMVNYIVNSTVLTRREQKKKNK